MPGGGASECVGPAVSGCVLTAAAPVFRGGSRRERPPDAPGRPSSAALRNGPTRHAAAHSTGGNLGGPLDVGPTGAKGLEVRPSVRSSRRVGDCSLRPPIPPPTSLPPGSPGLVSCCGRPGLPAPLAAGLSAHCFAVRGTDTGRSAPTPTTPAPLPKSPVVEEKWRKGAGAALWTGALTRK